MQRLAFVRHPVTHSFCFDFQILDRDWWRLDGHHWSATGTRGAHWCVGHCESRSENGATGLGAILRVRDDHAG